MGRRAHLCGQGLADGAGSGEGHGQVAATHGIRLIRTTSMNIFRSRRLLLPLILVALTAVAGVRAVAPSGTYFEVTKHLEILTSVFKGVHEFYVEEPEPGTLMSAAIKAMLDELDPYTIYYPESRIEDLRFMTTGEYGGIGASIQFMNDRHLFIDVLPDFPAAKAGLKIGDELIRVDGQALGDVNPELVSELLQGASGTEVILEYIPNGSSEVNELRIEREKIKLPAVPFRTAVADSTGYVILRAFTRG